jgi:protein-S-isoprenylcysteine O-methyltransferase Ste14
MSDKPARGGEWVLWQFVLLLAILVAPRRLPGIPGWSPGATRTGRIAGLLSMAACIAVMRLGDRQLGDNLTPFPRPKADGTLVQTGIYGQVRHPLYLAFILGALGWSLLRGSTPALLLTLVLAIFFDSKAAAEEAWLVQRFPEYAAYRLRVAKFVPGLY